MIHPIFKAALKRPDLVFQHLANYVELLKEEAADLGKGLALQAVGAVAAIVALLLALGLTGVAVMQGVLHGTFNWVLVIVPGVAWLFVLIGVAIAMRSTLQGEIQDVRDEVASDLEVLRVAKDMTDE